MSEFKIPTETVSLPSKGLLYPKESPLASGQVEMKYMTAREEDILTNRNYLVNGTWLDKLLKSLIVSPINYDDLLSCDKDAILIAARILGYGKDYSILYGGKQQTIDLSKLEDKKIDMSLFEAGTNDFSFSLPKTGRTVTFKLLTHADEVRIDQEIKGLQKINPDSSPSLTTRMKHMITSVDGNREVKTIRDFVDNALLAPDARSLRQYYNQISPGIDLKFIPNDESYVGEGVGFEIEANFFWPDTGV
jgi:hypothetical protein